MVAGVIRRENESIAQNMTNVGGLDIGTRGREAFTTLLIPIGEQILVRWVFHFGFPVSLWRFRTPFLCPFGTGFRLCRR